MAIGGLSAANGVAKITGEGWFTIFQQTSQLANMMTKGRGTPVGARGYELATEEDGNYSVGFPVEGGNLPPGNSVQTIRPVVYTKRMMLACQLTGASMQELGKNHESEMYTENWVDLNLSGTLEAAKKLENIYSYGSGNGRLGTVSTGASSTTQTFTGSGAGYDWTRYLRKNMSIQFVDPATGLYRNATPVTITNSIGPFATTITTSASVSTTTGDYAVAAGSWNQAPNGLAKIVDDGTQSSVYFQNINRTDHPKYSAQVLSAQSTSLSLSIMRRMLGYRMMQARGENKGKFQIWSNESQWSVIASLGWPMKRYEGSNYAAKFGFKSIEFEGNPWTTEVDAPLDKVWFMDFDKVWKFTNTDWQWDETTGSIWVRIPSSTVGYNMADKFEGYYFKIEEYGSPDPRMSGVITSLSVPLGYYA